MMSPEREATAAMAPAECTGARADPDFGANRFTFASKSCLGAAKTTTY